MAKPVGRWRTLPVYSTKVHFFVPPKERGQAWPSLCPQFYSMFIGKNVKNPPLKQRCKTCNDRLARLTDGAPVETTKVRTLP